MKKTFFIFLIAALFACTNESETATLKENTDTTGRTTPRKDDTIKGDTVIPVDTVVGYR